MAILDIFRPPRPEAAPTAAFILVSNNRMAEMQAKETNGLILDCRELLAQFNEATPFDSRVYLTISGQLLSGKNHQSHLQEKLAVLKQNGNDWLYPVRCLELLQDIRAALKIKRLTLALTYFDADTLSSSNPTSLSQNQELILAALNNLSGADRYIYLKNRQLAERFTCSNSR